MFAKVALDSARALTTHYEVELAHYLHTIVGVPAILLVPGGLVLHLETGRMVREQRCAARYHLLIVRFFCYHITRQEEHMELPTTEPAILDRGQDEQIDV